MMVGTFRVKAVEGGVEGLGGGGGSGGGAPKWRLC